jgi:purine-binding chemotaxis protein CheW
VKEGALQLVIVELDGRRYGLRADAVAEVVRAVTIAPLPNAPPAVEGIINVRGSIVAVLDIRRRFGLPAKPLDPSQYFVLARAGGRDVALHVDHAVDLVAVDPDAVDRAEAALGRNPEITGVVKLDDGLVLIHDLESFLSAAEGSAVDEALGARKPAPVLA